MTGCLLSRACRQGDEDPAPSMPSVLQLPLLPREPRDEDDVLGPHPGVLHQNAMSGSSQKQWSQSSAGAASCNWSGTLVIVTRGNQLFSPSHKPKTGVLSGLCFRQRRIQALTYIRSINILLVAVSAEQINLCFSIIYFFGRVFQSSGRRRAHTNNDQGYVIW